MASNQIFTASEGLGSFFWLAGCYCTRFAGTMPVVLVLFLLLVLFVCGCVHIVPFICTELFLCSGVSSRRLLGGKRVTCFVVVWFCKPETVVWLLKWPRL